ncbi:proteasome stabiliser-domain-containing protein [Rhypophila decipiens]|uniref:Proteasome stabiliser-domain-containing protein n=1 Tax=Rhypophila decipiens TaxID=261697 RepID=A0AAN6YB92_9PEZI|nr:proteasome stabiliser-domain-containing protein [Rhypophila decipiens]
MSTEQRELNLVEKVDFKILAVANNEQKLQDLLKVYLAPLLLKLASEHASVRNKTMEACQRIPTFIQAPGIILPVEALLAQYKSQSSPLVRHFDLMFIQHSVGRLDDYERRQLIPKAIKGIASDTSPSKPKFFNFFLRLLQDLKPPPRGSKEDESLREAMSLPDPKDASFIAEWLGKLFLLKPNVPGAATSPGLTEADVAFLTLSNKRETWSPADKGLNLPETRIKALQFLASGAFTDDEKFMPALYAASSTDFRLSELGEDILKRSTVSLEDKDLVKKLFAAHRVLSPPYRIRILNLLSKSQVSTMFKEEILDIFKQNVINSLRGSGGGGDEMDIDGGAGAPPNTKAKSGLELTKVHRATFQYINWVARVGPINGDEQFAQLGLLLVSLLMDFIESQGWPRPTASSKEGGGLSADEVKLRSGAYEMIGILAKSTESMPPDERLGLSRWLFRSLSEDPTSEAIFNIEGVLSSFSSMMKGPSDEQVKSQLRALLLTYMMVGEGGDQPLLKQLHRQEAGAEEGEFVVVRSVRHAATRWANNCLPFSDVLARWIDILALAGRRDERSDVLEEGQKGLDPWTYYAHDEKATVELPSWQEMVDLFFKKNIPSSVLHNFRSGSAMEIDGKSAVFTNFQGDVLRAFPKALKYCAEVLFLTALKDSFKFEPQWEMQLSTLVHSNMATRRFLREYLSSNAADSYEATYALLSAAFEGMVLDDDTIDAEWRVNCANVFVDVASFVPKMILQPFIRRWEELITLVCDDKKEMRHLGAVALGIIGAHPGNSDEDFKKIMDSLASIANGFHYGAVGSKLNAVEGAFLGLGYLCSRRVHYGLAVPDSAVGVRDVLPTLKTASNKGLSTQEALFEAYSQLWTTTIYEMPGSGSYETDFIGPLVAQAKKGNEKAIRALGFLAMSLEVKDESDEQDIGLVILQGILLNLFSLYEIKQAEVHFAVGEAIAAAIACWDAEAVLLILDVESQPQPASQNHKRPTAIKDVLDKLLTDCKTTKPSLLKASGIWLFCIIQHCSHLEEVQSRLRECQVAFTRLLGARDELVQETASRGLGLVYEKGDPELKDQLVKDLVASFTGTGPKLKVEAETELFDDGALPTGEGKSITSYKDILSLASEVGDQSLVYKFMSLATNAATWSTRSAFGRFGLSNILSEGEVDPKLYPKLYRYRFDPNPNVQKSMNDIWKALVKDSNAVLEEHFDAIIRDLLKSVLGKEWRVREASCAAIGDLLGGRPFQKYEKYYSEIWAAALKVLDDVKGTVRKAALHLCIGLTTTLERQLTESGSSTASATAMMNEALPFLMSDNGMGSGVEDVKLFATVTVIKLCKKGGKSMKPYIAQMVSRLLAILSTLEPDALNYHYQRMGDEVKERIDKARTAAVTASPLMEAIESLLRSADQEVMAALAPRLEEAIKAALGLHTKIGCGRVLSTLATGHTNDFRPYAGRFLQLMEKQLLDRNDEVSQGYARAAAYVIRAAPDEDQLRFVARLRKLYLTSEDEARRQKVADAVLAMSKVSSDYFTALESQLLPLAYLAKHSSDESVRKACEEVWGDHAGSEMSVTRYIPEVVELVKEAMGTAQWALRHSSAFTISDAVAAVLASNTLSGTADLTNLEKLWPEYEKALAMKTFEGKEKLLETFPDFVAKTKALWESTGDKQKQGFAELLKKIAIREAKRNNADYRPHAFRCLWKFAAVRDDLDMLGDIVDVVSEYLDITGDKMDIDDDDNKASKKETFNKSRGMDAKTLTVWAAMEAVAKGYNRAGMKKNPLAELAEVVEAFERVRGFKGTLKGKEWWGAEDKPFIALEPFDIIRRVYWYDCAEGIMKDAVAGLTSDGDEAGPAGDVGVLGWFLATLDLDKPDMGIEEVRLARVRATMAVVKVTKAVKGVDGELLTKVGEFVEKALGEERSLVVQGKWKDVLGALKG